MGGGSVESGQNCHEKIGRAVTYRDGVKDVYELSIHSDEALWRVDERGSGLGRGFYKC